MSRTVDLRLAQREELPEFCKKLQEAFAVSAEKAFGPSEEPIPSDQDVWEAFNAPGAAVYHVLLDGQKAGGVVLTIDETTQHNHLALFFVFSEYHSQGIGLTAWQAVETLYPETKVWETGTPYFEQRNIHFYVNKCGFHIVEFYNRHHPDPHMPLVEFLAEANTPGGEGFFRFEKVMKQ